MYGKSPVFLFSMTLSAMIKSLVKIMRLLYFLLFLFLISPLSADARYLGRLSANRFNADSTSNPFGAGSRFRSDSINNQFGEYGSRFSNKSVNNPYATDAPKLYDSEENYRGKLSANRYDPESISNPYGRYGSKFSPDSINNPFGAGNRFRSDSPNNPFGSGWYIISD